MLSPLQLAKLIDTIVDKKQEKLPTTATVVGVDYPTVNIQIGSSPSILKTHQGQRGYVRAGGRPVGFDHLGRTTW